MENWQHFTLSDFGFQIGVPDTWTIQDTVAVQANRARIGMGSEALQKKFQQATLPIFVSTRFPDGYDDVNPTVQVIYRPVPEPGAPATAMLEKIMAGMSMIVPRFELVVPVAETELGGLPGACARTSFVMEGDERSFDILGRSWIVPRSEMMFMIGMSGPAKGENVLEDAFGSILNTIRIESNDTAEA